MIRILSADTSTSISTIAVCEGEADATANTRVLSEMVVECRRLHAERLIASIDWLLNEAGLALNDINALAISIGPGSFTGLRIGAATWKGLALARDLPLVAVPTLDALTRNAYFLDATVCAVLDARMKEVYGAWFQSGNGVILRLSSDQALPPGKLIEGVKGPSIFFGSGAIRYRRQIVEALGERALFPPEEIMGARASTVGRLALKKFLAGEVDDLASLEPLYIRQAQAVVARSKKT